MDKNEKSKCLVVVVVAIAVAVLLGWRAPTSDQLMSLSIPTLRTTERERVVGFELHVTSGRIAELPNVPIGWGVSVNNSPSWNTVFRGSSLVGAAAVDPDFFTDFLVVEKNESLGLPFEVRGEVIVTQDFVSERRINIGMRDFAIGKRVARTQPVRR